MKRLLLSLLALIVPVAFADDVLKLGTVYDLPVMYLSSPITSTTQVEPEITIAAPIRNGSALIIPSLSGAVFEIAFGGYTESVYASRVAVNSTTGVITLTGSVVRDLCYNQATSFTSCNNGRRWGKGAQVRLVDTAKRFNRLADITRSNLFNAKGAIKFSGSGSLGQPVFATTAERDRQLGSSPASGSGLVACVVATGLCYDGIGGSWVSRAAGSTANASDTVAGKVQDGTLDHLQNRTMTGSTGAFNAVSFRWLVKNGSGAETFGRVLQAGNNGALSPSLGGTGLPSPTASGVLIGNGNKNSMLQTSGQLLRANSKLSWFAWTPTGIVTQWSQQNEKLTTSNGTQNFTTNYTLPAGFSTGSMVIIEASGTGASTGAFYRYGLKLGSTQICESNQMDGGSPNHAWKLRGELTVKRNGAAGQLFTNCTINGGSVFTQSGGIVSINTTTTNAVNLSLRSNGTTGYSYLINLIVTPFLR